jgi:hypothetical protein
MPKKAGPDLTPVFDRLRQILTPYAAPLAVKTDTPDAYYLEAKSPDSKGRLICFGFVRKGKNYVSFHLMPLSNPGLAARVSPTLKKRQQGKSCFNFTQIDDQLFEELARLTEAGRQGFARMGFLP